MRLPKFEVLVPRTLTEACAMLRDHARDDAKILAGGTDLLVGLRQPIIPQHVPRCDGCRTHPKGMIRSTVECSLWDTDPEMAGNGYLRSALLTRHSPLPTILISLHKLSELKQIQVLDNGSLRIGALTTISEVQRFAAIRTKWTALAEAADSLGSPLVRNRGTLGGNIANARPAADMAVATITHGGILTLNSHAEQRSLPAADFPLAPGKTVLKSDEIVSGVTYPPPAPYTGSTYYKLANRKALDISMVGVAVSVSLAEPGGPVSDIRVGLGAVAPRPILAPTVREVLIGKVPTDKLLSDVGEAAANDCRPIDDHRASAWYRIQMVRTLTCRLVGLALKRAGGSL
jgi:CO/xanthine dehydrogenase FAD-binding subunit